MTQESTAQTTGICTTCVENGHCLFNQASRYPIWHCDQFDTGEPIKGATAPLKLARAPRVRPAASDKG